MTGCSQICRQETSFAEAIDNKPDNHVYVDSKTVSITKKQQKLLLLIGWLTMHVQTNINTNMTNTIWKAARKALAIQDGCLWSLTDMTRQIMENTDKEIKGNKFVNNYNNVLLF